MAIYGWICVQHESTILADIDFKIIKNIVIGSSVWFYLDIDVVFLAAMRKVARSIAINSHVVLAVNGPSYGDRLERRLGFGPVTCVRVAILHHEEGAARPRFRGKGSRRLDGQSFWYRRLHQERVIRYLDQFF